MTTKKAIIGCGMSQHHITLSGIIITKGQLYSLVDFACPLQESGQTSHHVSS